MAQNGEQASETEIRLLGLQSMIKQVYLPVLDKQQSSEEKSEKNEIQLYMVRFCSHIQTSLQQAYGNVTINVPEIPQGMDEDAISRNPSLVKQLTEAVQSWAETIKETMDRAAKSEKTRTHDTASGETIYWSNRSALFNTLYQQLNKQTVRRILNVLSAGERNENGALEEYNAQFHDFSIAYAKAKDFVKFLMTLDRQFRNLSQGTLKNIEETLPSLLNGLKLIWTISRHISQKEEEFEHILEGISNEICSKVRMEIDIKKIFNEKPIENALFRIDQAIVVLEQWYAQYNKTKIEIESTGSTPRWEFSNSKAIFQKPLHMVVIIRNIGEACKVLKEFKAILGKELKQVTGSSDTIDAVSARVNEQIRKLVNFPNDVFNPEHHQDWQVAYGQFQSSIEAIETETTNLIQTTFEHKLSSSENAFDLLSKFKHLETRPAIKTELESKYTNVLDAYNRELSQMEALYNKYQQNCPIPKNMPPRSGSIAWARSIITRIKTPIDKFTTKPEILTEFQPGRDAARNYVRIAKELTENYETTRFDEWRQTNTAAAIKMLGDHILKVETDAEGQKVYKVNFDPELKVIIREAKFLDRIGKLIPPTIINIALQEKDYMQYIDKLNLLLRNYNAALTGLKPVEKKLLLAMLSELDIQMMKGANDYNWFSLSIKEYIAQCQKAIAKFKDMKDRLMQQSANIEKKVKTIEEAEIIRTIDFKTIQLREAQELMEWFDGYRLERLNELVKDYQLIGDQYLKSIEGATFNSQTCMLTEMLPYYKYWERKVFNAITKMIIRALAVVKAILMSRDGVKPLIRMDAGNNNLEIIYQPPQEEMQNQLEKFHKNIIDSTKQFGRWKDKTCKVFPYVDDHESTEKIIKYTFYDDVIKNPVIISLTEDNTHQIKKLVDKFDFYSTHLFNLPLLKSLYDMNRFNHQHRQMEKHLVDTFTVEQNIIKFREYKRFCQSLIGRTQQNGPILIDFGSVYSNAVKQADLWLEMMGKSLSENAKTKLNKILKTIKDWETSFNVEPDYQTIKELLTSIKRIRGQSMDMELEIIESLEQFRVLRMYEHPVEPEDDERINKLEKVWDDLIELAERKDHLVGSYKDRFARGVQQNIEGFKTEVQKEFENYRQSGPGAEHIDLDEGVALLAASKDTVAALNHRKDDYVMSENLFNLPLSKYPQLIKMEDDNAIYSQIYDIYVIHNEKKKGYAMESWNRIDPNALREEAESQQRLVRALGKKLNVPDKHAPFRKLKDIIGSFQNSLPLIEQLRNPAIVERHWNRIIEETGKMETVGEINLKSINLQKVLELKLDQYTEIVNNVCVEAVAEENNEKQVAEIDKVWKETNFDLLSQPKKGDPNEKVPKIVAVDDIRQKLEDCIMTLQSVGASKYARSVKAKVAQWEKDLIMISDVMDCWLLAQREWIYLESIFSGDDIKQQLPEQAKKFMRFDANWVTLMNGVDKQRNCRQNCVLADGGQRLSMLQGFLSQFDQLKKSLNSYLEGKKMAFPRFYSLSEEDLLQILGSPNPQTITVYLLKLFDACKLLRFENGGKLVTAMVSDEGEEYKFIMPVRPEGNVEDWMGRVDAEMKRTLHYYTKEAIFNYAREDRIDWLRKQIGMVAIIGTQVWWTFAVEDVFKRVKNDKYAMKNELKKESDDIDNLISLIRTDISDKLRKSINCLIILDVHQRDIVDMFVRDSKLSADEFDWQKQLRFYWEPSTDDVCVRQCTGVLQYSYEYMGLNTRLVITPLTDRCVMTLTTALTFFLGGAPAGPAGTGKTETVRDLAKSLALRCLVTCCGETLDSTALGAIFSGLIQNGFWGCFDEFNRINREVLSVVSTQIKTIQIGLAKKVKILGFQDTDLPLVHTIGIFITMNPGYAGRSELPDNLKALFRPVTMVVPELIMICENMLMSEGFNTAANLSVKMVTLYKLTKEQLSKQYHYEFGLRPIKSVLVQAGFLKRTYPDMPEDAVLMRALRDMNMPKFVFEDEPLFKGLLQDLFPGLRADRVGNEDLKQNAKDILEKGGYGNPDEKHFEDQVLKIIQLFETSSTRHTTMVVGPTSGGKSVIINTLAQALYVETDVKTTISIMNAKTLTTKELYGVLDPDSRDWTDGLLSKLYRAANTPPEQGAPEQRQWILFDGDVDAIWIENMNSVMDDNRILTLDSGDRLQLLRHCILMFEVFDLQYSSPATISRCGMVYVDPKNLGYKPFYQRWLKGKAKYGDTIQENFRDLYQKYFPVVMDRIYEGMTGDEELAEPLQFITPRTNVNLIEQLTILIDSILPEDPEAAPQEFNYLEKLFLFCLTWSCGGALIEKDREVFNAFLSTTAQTMLPHNLYENVYDIKTQKLDLWSSRVKEYVPPADGTWAAILVPTMDTTRYAWLLTQIQLMKRPVCFSGDSGAAKTVTVAYAFQGMSVSNPDEYIYLTVNFSSRTSSADFQGIIMENIDRKSGKIYGPKTPGKKLIFFVDDMNMPTIDRYGTQQPNALLKFIIERGQLYERKGELDLLTLSDLQYVGCTTPPAGGNNAVDPRLMSLFSVFNVTSPSKDSVSRIFNTILAKRFSEFPEEVTGQISNMTTATLQLFSSISEKLPRTPLKFHYIFNLRNISSVYEGVYGAVLDKTQTKAAVVRLWRHECICIFADRLINAADRALVCGQLIPDLVKRFFNDVSEEVMADPILYGDYALSDPTFEDGEDPRLYEDLGSFEKVREKMEKMLEEYNFENPPMPLVLFDECLSHVTKVHRIIRFQKGCAMLVGYGGSGKQSVTKLATYVAGYKVWTINLVRNYKEADFRADLQELYKCVLKKPRSFLFTDAHAVDEGFFELINNILTIGMVPALFPEEEKEGFCQMVDAEIKKNKLPDSKDARWSYFVKKARENIHIVLAMSPAGDTLKVRCRNFPGLVSNTTIDWFFPWPLDALNDVAESFLSGIELASDVRKPVQEHITRVHMTIQDYSVEFDKVYKRKNFSTPKNYLDFLHNYIKFLGVRRKQKDNSVIRLEAGLGQLAAAGEATDILAKELEVQNADIAEKKTDVEAIIETVNIQSAEVNEQANIAKKTEEELSVAAVEINRIAKDAAEAVARAEPALQAAKKALEKVDKKDIGEIKALANPPEAIKLTCCVCYHLLVNSKDDGWDQIKSKMLGRMGLVDDMKSINIGEVTRGQAERVKSNIKKMKQTAKLEGEELVEWIRGKSGPTSGMWCWAVSTDECYDIYKDVKPKQDLAAKMKSKSEKSAADLAKIQAKVKELQDSLAVLTAQKNEKTAILNKLEETAARLKRRLDAAAKLITGLGGEQVRWTADMANLGEAKAKLVGDCLTASAFLSYCGPFNYVLRQKMLFEDWQCDLVEKAIPRSEDFKLDTFLTDEVEVSRWASEGLPTDELSVQNGILTSFASRWPLCIDPQMQAITWIKEKEKKAGLRVLTFNTDGFVKLLENAIKFGTSILFEGLDTELDPIIDPVLEKNITKEAGIEMLTLGDQKIEYNQDFRMALVTKLANPSYSPEVFGKTMIINFSVTLGGLKDQLLNQVVEFERPELEKMRKELIASNAANRQEQKELEDLLLSELSKESDVPLVDNEPLIKVLGDAKAKSIKIAGDLEIAAETGVTIEASRQDYTNVAKRGAILFFCMTGLSAISQMYEYSLNSYNTIFKGALETSKKDNVLPARIRFIIERLTLLFYEFVCMGIFEAHKLTFSFQMTTMIMDGDGTLDKRELDFFLKGNTSLDEIDKNPIKWLEDAGWKNSFKLDSLGGVWAGFQENMKDYQKKWKKWFDEETPEQVEMPCGYTDKLSKFQQMLVCKVFRPDRCVNAIKNFIMEKMSPVYVSSPPIMYDKIYKQSTEKTPIVFVLSPGADPQAEVQKLADELGYGQSKFIFAALGQGMESHAQAMIERGAIRGHWIMLNNCHLLAKWLKTMEAIIEKQTKPDKNFRLWLTTEPTDEFPLGILQKSLKVVTEPPDGLGANLRSNYVRLTDEDLEASERAEFKQLVYVLSFFHAVIQERKKYGKIGWNIRYDFNASDFNISFRLIALYLNKALDEGEEELPWETLRYLIGEAMYGGRVTDDFDRRVMNCYLQEYCGDFIFDTNQKFYFSRVNFDYLVPALDTHEAYMESIEQIPVFTSPQVYGLHNNAEIIYYRNYASQLWFDTLSMQTSDASAGGGADKEDFVAQVAGDIESSLPELFDIYNIRKKFEVPSPTQVVLMQELERFNILLEMLKKSLSDLQKALKGQIGFTADLDDLSNSMFNGFVPTRWKSKAPQTLKPLVSWMAHFHRRFKQYKDWDEIEEPKVIWLSGLQTPESYTTALIQAACRGKGWPLDKAIMYTVITKEKSAAGIKKKLEYGTYVQGLYLEGARWNLEKDCLDYQRPKELIEELPLMQVIPVMANQLKLRNTLKTPVYVTQDRKNAMGVGGVFIADVKTDKHISHWTLQGVAIVLNTSD